MSEVYRVESYNPAGRYYTCRRESDKTMFRLDLETAEERPLGERQLVGQYIRVERTYPFLLIAEGVEVIA